jgi:SAM-dependent methyltransferase
MMAEIPIEQHNKEIQQNLEAWARKPFLQKAYQHFYLKIKNEINTDIKGHIVEIGSGIGNLKTVVPNSITTDLFKNPWIDQVEDIYHLSFSEKTVSNLILFDVWHHIEYPGNALHECFRVLTDNGRIIMFEPAISFLGSLVYGLFHHEPVKLFKKINWYTDNLDSSAQQYYAAQGNASRMFWYTKNNPLKKNWKIRTVKKYSALSYLVTGGYSKKSLCPAKMFKLVRFFEKIADLFPVFFASRLLIVLEKK